VSEADDVSVALHEAGLRAREASKVLERRIEAAVHQAEQAQAKLLEGQKHEAIGRLTGGIAHDFNNLLQTISTSLQVLDKTTSDARHRKVLESSMRACTRAADLVRQMLTFGRMQAQRPKPLNLRDFMLDHQELMLRAVGSRVRLSASIDPGLPGVYVDPTQLELAMLNLLFNASQAMPEGGSVDITARMAESSETASLGTIPCVCIQVVDDGPGMPPDVLARAFEPYFTTKPIGAGSGLGLAQVKSFARQSGGDVLLDSGPGRGTRACILLPASDLPVAPEQGPAQEVVVQRPLKILMVEDDVLISSVVVPALEAEGHQVQLCSTADHALPVLSEGAEFDVVFTDIVMPGKLSGLDLMNWCLEHRPTLATLVTSGYAKELKNSQVQVLNKPYGMRSLLAALQRAVDEKRRTDTAGS
jgi:signal transduction histidine kinase/ActR/RegA family two-component response regulator